MSPSASAELPDAELQSTLSVKLVPTTKETATCDAVTCAAKPVTPELVFRSVTEMPNSKFLSSICTCCVFRVVVMPRTSRLLCIKTSLKNSASPTTVSAVPPGLVNVVEAVTVVVAPIDS